MGFVRERKTFKITWDDGSELAGLEIRARSVSTGQFLAIHRLARAVDEENDDRTAAEVDELLASYEKLTSEFAKVLISWNLEEPGDDGTPQPVPATHEGLLGQELDLVLMVVYRWIAVMTGVSDDLGKDSTSGEQLAEASLPMEPLSPSPENSPTPV